MTLQPDTLNKRKPQVKQTSIYSIIAVIIKELRLAASCDQKSLSIQLKGYLSYITKLEDGSIGVRLENLYSICYALQQSPSEVIATAELYAMWFEKFLNFNVSLERIPLDDDDFIQMSNMFYKRKKVGKIDLTSTEYALKNQVLMFPEKMSEIDSLSLVGVFAYIDSYNPSDAQRVMAFFGKDFAKNYEAFKLSKVGITDL